MSKQVAAVQLSQYSSLAPKGKTNCPDCWGHDENGTIHIPLPNCIDGRSLELIPQETPESIYDCGPITPSADYEGATKIFSNETDGCIYYRQKDGTWYSPTRQSTTE